MGRRSLTATAVQEAQEPVATESDASKQVDGIFVDTKDVAGRHLDEWDNNRQAEFKQTLAALAADLDPKLLKRRQQGGQELTYISWDTAADLLDHLAPTWSNEIKDVRIVGDKLVIINAITINGVTRENVGIEDLNTNSYGDVSSNAFSMAFKRTGALFGLGRGLYRKDDSHASSDSRPEPRSAPRSSAPAANNPPANIPGGLKQATIKAPTTGTSQKTGNTYDYLPVLVAGDKYDKKVFLDRDCTIEQILDAIQAPIGSKYPIQCLVKVEKKGDYWNITEFHPVPQESASVEGQPAGVDPDDDVPF